MYFNSFQFQIQEERHINGDCTDSFKWNIVHKQVKACLIIDYIIIILVKGNLYFYQYVLAHERTALYELNATDIMWVWHSLICDLQKNAEAYKMTEYNGIDVATKYKLTLKIFSNVESDLEEKNFFCR